VRPTVLVAGLAALLVALGSGQPAAAQSDPRHIDLVVSAGRPLRVAVDEKTQIKNVGQPVTGTVTEPVYAYDRIVIEAGTRVRGHVLKIDSGSKLVRARAYMSGNLSPTKHATLQFDTLILDGGHEMSIETVVKGGIPNVTRKFAGGSGGASREPAAANDDADPTLKSRARSEITQRKNEAVAGAKQAVSDAKQKVRDGFASIKSLREPGQMGRLKDAAVQQLPYHPQYLAKGTVYDAELSTPVSFGTAMPADAAPEGTKPAPDSVLTARLATTLDSSKTPRGTLFEAA
jgi:type IV secretory pathway VirB10-like protein